MRQCAGDMPLPVDVDKRWWPEIALLRDFPTPSLAPRREVLAAGRAQGWAAKSRIQP